MNLLLDTCALLWALHDPDKLSNTARKALTDPDNTIHVSAVSFWEISLKASRGKLFLDGVRFEDFPVMATEEDWQIHSGITAANVRPRKSNYKDPFEDAAPSGAQ